MQTLEALRRRLDTIEELRSFVRTMKSLSAVSIRQYERAAESLADYEHTIDLGFQAVLGTDLSPFASPRLAESATAAIIFGSDRGLCGRFNDEIARFATEQLRGSEIVPADRPRLAAGTRVAARLDVLDEAVEDVLTLPGSAEGLTATTREILLQIEEWRTRGISRVLLFHHRHTETATASPQMVRLLPLDPERFRRLASSRWPSRGLPGFTLEPEELLRALLRQYFFALVFRAGAESLASEHATRLAALEAAERHIDEHLEETNAELRRRRQESITEELLDIVSGFEVLRSGSDEESV